MIESAWPRITGVGARTALGLSSLQVTLCARARALAPAPCAHRDARGVPFGVVRAAAVPDDVVGLARWLALAAPALRECASGGDARPVPVFLALPEPGRADHDPTVDEGLLPRLAQRSGVAIDVGRSSLVRAGSAGFAVALASAAARLAAGEPSVIVGGVDSYYHPALLAALDADRRVHSAVIDAGIVPSEGAAFVRLERPVPGADSLGALVAAHADVEASVTTGAPNLGQAITRVVREAAASAPGGDVAWVLVDANGELDRQDEWTKARLRVREVVGERARVDTPIDDHGELGAATGAVLLATVITAWRVGLLPADAALLALHSEGPTRGAVLAHRGS